MFLKTSQIRLWIFLLCLWISFVLGIFWCRYVILPTRKINVNLCNAVVSTKQPINMDQVKTNKPTSKDILFIGVMTSGKFLLTRAQGVFDTWGKTVPGKLVFFAGKSPTKTTVNFPVIYLSVPDNIHPPQRKSLVMLRYIHDHFINQYHWFVRADDDVYIRPQKLLNFLLQIDSSQHVLLGQAGVGKQHERGKLGLKEGDNFCIGGPGIIMSQPVLKSVSLHLSYCSNHTATSHEDTEVGRCLRNFAGVMCPWAYQARDLFHHEYENQDIAYHDDLSTNVVTNAITLHPIKDPAYMRRLHVHYLTTKLNEVNHNIWLLKHRLRNVKEATRHPATSTITAKKDGVKKRRLRKTWKKVFTDEKERFRSVEMLLNKRSFFTNLLAPSSSKNVSLHHKDAREWRRWFRGNSDFFGAARNTCVWESFTARKLHPLFENSPLRWLNGNTRDGLVRVLRESKRMVDKRNSETRKYHTMRLGSDLLGYVCNNAVLGVQYILEISTISTIRPNVTAFAKKVTEKHTFKFQHPFSPLLYNTIQSDLEETVHFIVPLAGRFNNFHRFLDSFERDFLRRGQKVKILVVYFPKLMASSKHIQLLRSYKKRYPHGVFHWLNINTDNFQRGLALNKGADYFGGKALLFFADVDLVFQTEFLYRCRANTKLSEQVYFPMMFSKYHPNITNPGGFKDHFNFQRDKGLWRLYSYGPVCIYGDDVTAVGGFNTTIKGWGLEDVDFFEKIVKSNKMLVHRSPDPGLVHVFHRHAQCGSDLPQRQLTMCNNAKSAYLTSKSNALQYLLSKKYL